MEIKSELIGKFWKSKNITLEICEDNIKELKAHKADVFNKPKRVKYKGIKEDDVKDSEGTK